MPVKNDRLHGRIRKLGTGPLSDALGKTGAMDHDMQCRSANARMAGPAFTLRVHTADILMVAKALSLCPAAHVLVIDGQGEKNTALWGGLTTAAAYRKGLEGVVIDGAVRDVADIRRSRLPVFARAVVPNAGGAEYAGEIGASVQCGGVVVAPGDWVVGDDDGIVVVPADRLEEAAATAGRILAAERQIAKQIREGRDIGEILRCDEVLARKASTTFLPQLRAVEKVKRARRAGR
jgi:3-hexulose-6-phosphate synthase/6-phospho-3-hexuloisomerase